MKTLPAALTAALQGETLNLKHLIQLTIGGTVYRWTDSDQDIYYANWWSTKGIHFSSIEMSLDQSIDSMTFEVDNVDKGILNLALAQTLSGSECLIYMVALDNSLAVLGDSTLRFMGYIDSVKINKKKAVIEVFNHLIKWKTAYCPKRNHSPVCQWIFKSTYCGYAGAETWCDHTWERCGALSNTLNHGGFPTISEMVTKQISWGRKDQT